MIINQINSLFRSQIILIVNDFKKVIKIITLNNLKFQK